MISTWAYFRIWFFPYYVIARIIEEIQVWPAETYSHNIAFMTVGFLLALAALHVFWFYIMIKGAAKRLTKVNWVEFMSLRNWENRFA